MISEGALCAFPPGFTGRDGEPLPLIMRKSDGGYGYATTDLAAISYRIRDLKADRIIYVVGAEQSLHFRMVFAVGAAGRLADRRRVAPSTPRSACARRRRQAGSGPAAASRSS